MIYAAALRKLCLSIAGMRRDLLLRRETSVFKVAGKMFALSELTEHPLRVSTASTSSSPRCTQASEDRYDLDEP
jgi:hypothetical protein